MARRSKAKEQEEWHNYYHRISQYERWSCISGKLSSFLYMLKQHLRETEGSEHDLYLEVEQACERVKEAVRRGTSRYCETKPQKPYPRPYGFF